MRKSLPVSALVVLSVAALGACGDDDSGSSATTKAAATTVATSAAPTTAAATAAASTTAAATTVAPKPGPPIKIGAVLSVTGPGSSLGAQQKNTLEMLTEQLNAAGGFKGRKVELKVADDQSNPDRAVEQTRALIQEFKPTAIVGASLSGSCLATKPVTQEAGVLQYCLSAANIPTPAPLYFSAQSPLGAWIGNLPFEYFKEKGFKKIGCLASDDASGQLTVGVLKPAAKGAGIELFTENFNIADVDVSAQLTRLRDKGLDAMYVCTSGTGVVTVLQGMKQLGINLPTWIGSGSASLPVAALIKDLLPSKGVLTGGEKIQVYEALPADDPQAKQIQAFATAYQAKFNSRPDLFAASAADAFTILLTAIEGAGEGANTAAVAKYMEDKVEYTGVQLTYNFTPEDHRGTGLSGIVVEFTDKGAFKFVKQFKTVTDYVAAGSK